MSQLPPQVSKALEKACGQASLRVGFLTGAGISSESGIPTFRGPEGYWTVGSRVYHPMELATQSAFSETPWEVWRWYLYREAVCRAAQPNAGHMAITAISQLVNSETTPLMTQNVDGLHRRAGFPTADLYEIHGHIGEMRCAARCSWDRWSLPQQDVTPDQVKSLTDDILAETLRCPHCGSMSRPHVLWFDEYYEEALFRSESALSAMEQTDLLITVGTSAATNLPVQTIQRALQRGATVIDINPGPESPFGEAAERRGGAWWRAPAASALSELQVWFERHQS
jgi:NAD-dependent deacetylase